MVVNHWWEHELFIKLLFFIENGVTGLNIRALLFDERKYIFVRNILFSYCSWPLEKFKR